PVRCLCLVVRVDGTEFRTLASFTSSGRRDDARRSVSILLVPSAEERCSWTASSARSLPEEVERPLVCCCLCVEEAIGRCSKVLSNRGRGSRIRGSGGGSGCERWQRTMQRQEEEGAAVRLPTGSSGAGH
ncbi:hypothetical protein BHM03_00012309, partial [Ensete ventricosum]